MGAVWRFEDLELWKKARVLENRIFAITNNTQFRNDFDLIRQMRRAVGKLMDNIAEGFGRSSNYEFIQFLSIVKGSVAELQSQLYRSIDRKYLEPTIFESLYALAEEILKMSTALTTYLNKTEIKGLKFKDRGK